MEINEMEIKVASELIKWITSTLNVFTNIFYDKVAPELISLDRDALAAVDVPTMQDKVDTRQPVLDVELEIEI